MPELLFLYLVTAAFLAWTLAAPLIAKYGTWVTRDMGRRVWTDDDEEKLAIGFRVMGAIGLLGCLWLSVVNTIIALR